MSVKNRFLAERRDQAISRGAAVNTHVFVSRAENSEIWDVEGRRYIDFSSGISVVAVSLKNPKVIAAVKSQIDCFTHTCHHVVPYESYVRLGERLNKLLPGSFEKKTLFLTTGAEAIENAVKIARRATGRSAIIAFSSGFHGRTFMGMALTGKMVPYKAGFGAMPADVFHAPFPTLLHGWTTADALEALEALFRTDVDPYRVAAMVVEPVQGEGGFYPAPTDFLIGLREICDRYAILLIADEVQTGFARTGKMFAMEHSGVAADLTTMAKSLAGGFPLSAVTGRQELMDAPDPGSLGGTYGGNPLAIAAAHAVLDVIEEEGLCERADRLGARLKQRLASIRGDVPAIVDVRGPGFMNAIEFNDPISGKPSSEFATAVRLNALSKGLILLTCGAHGNVIRFLAPITIQDSVMNEGLDVVEAAIRETSNSRV